MLYRLHAVVNWLDDRTGGVSPGCSYVAETNGLHGNRVYVGETKDLVLLFGITVTYLEGRQAAEASRLFSILARRVARSLRVKVH